LAQRESLSNPLMSDIEIYRHLFLTKTQTHRGRHSTPFAETASMNSRDSSSPASFHSKIKYRRPQFRQLVQGARLGSSFHGTNALRSNSDIASVLVWNFPSCSSQWTSSSITNIQLPFRVGTRCFANLRCLQTRQSSHEVCHPCPVLAVVAVGLVIVESLQQYA
jgi:hypothetical protein